MQLLITFAALCNFFWVQSFEHAHIPHKHEPHQHRPHRHLPHAHFEDEELLSWTQEPHCSAGSFRDFDGSCSHCPVGKAFGAQSYPGVWQCALDVDLPGESELTKLPQRPLGGAFSFEIYFKQSLNQTKEMALLYFGAKETPDPEALSVTLVPQGLGKYSAKVELGVGGDSVLVSCPIAGTWTHLVATIDFNGIQRVFINRKLIGSVSRQKALSPRRIRELNFVGRGPNNDSIFAGTIASALVYDGEVLHGDKYLEGGLIGMNESYCQSCNGSNRTSVVGGAACAACPANGWEKYEDKAGQQRCIRCPHGSVCSGKGNEETLSCAAGYEFYKSSRLCEPCAPGTFKNKTGPEACAVCPVGKTTIKEDGAVAFTFSGSSSLRVQTCGGTSNGAPCLFPFTWNGYEYNTCTDSDLGGKPMPLAWCLTEQPDENAKREIRWGFCSCPSTLIDPERAARKARDKSVTLINFDGGHGRAHWGTRYSLRGSIEFSCLMASCVLQGGRFFSYDPEPTKTTWNDVPSVQGSQILRLPDWTPRPNPFNTSVRCELPASAIARMTKPIQNQICSSAVNWYFECKNGDEMCDERSATPPLAQKGVWGEEGLRLDGAGSYVELPPFKIGGPSTVIDVHVKPGGDSVRFSGKRGYYAHALANARSYKSRCALPSERFLVVCSDGLIINDQFGDHAEAKAQCASRGHSLPTRAWAEKLYVKVKADVKFSGVVWTSEPCGVASQPRVTIFETGNGERQHNIQLVQTGMTSAEFRVYVTSATCALHDHECIDNMPPLPTVCRSSELLHEGEPCDTQPVLVPYEYPSDHLLSGRYLSSLGRMPNRYIENPIFANVFRLTGAQVEEGLVHIVDLGAAVCLANPGVFQRLLAAKKMLAAFRVLLAARLRGGATQKL